MADNNAFFAGIEGENSGVHRTAVFLLRQIDQVDAVFDLYSAVLTAILKQLYGILIEFVFPMVDVNQTAFHAAHQITDGVRLCHRHNGTGHNVRRDGKRTGNHRLCCQL